MSKGFNVPGVFWAILIVILAPALVPVIEHVFPAATYQWSAVIVVVLVSVAKTVEIVYRRQLDKAMSAGSAPRPAAMAAQDGDDYTYERSYEKPQPALMTWLFGG